MNVFGLNLYQNFLYVYHSIIHVYPVLLLVFNNGLTIAFIQISWTETKAINKTITLPISYSAYFTCVAEPLYPIGKTGTYLIGHTINIVSLNSFSINIYGASNGDNNNGVHAICIGI